MLVVPVTDVASGVMHLATDASMTFGRRAGRYRTICGADVLAASLTAPEWGRCQACREASRG